ncbi:MAG: hypothetical protein IT310_14455 [Anaerolineales bacterium]|nr:hypothetical protein [Anaerolineales bacterium]
MRVTRDSLIRIAKETAQERAYNDPEIVAAYLTGSLLNVEPMLGGTADIDLVLVCKTLPAQTRELVKLAPDFHLDIRRRAKDEFKNPRELRSDPWLGYEMYDPQLLYEREKFFDFVQASLRAGFEFEQPALMLQRCRKLLKSARQVWSDLTEVASAPTPKELHAFLTALFYACNAIAEVTGEPLYERRLFLELPFRAEAVQKPGLAIGAYGLVGANQLDAEKITSWLGDWNAAFKLASVAPNVDARINPIRLNYYEKAIKALLEGENPNAALWPLLHTWTLSAEVLTGDHLNFWQSAVNELGLGLGFSERVEGLDHYLDEIEILLDELAAANGVE